MINLGNVVIGSSLKAVAFSYLNNYKLILNDKAYHHPFEKLDSGVDYASLFFYHPRQENIVKPNETIESLERKQFLLEHILFAISMTGNVPFSDMASKIILQEEKKQILVGTKNTNDTIRVGYDKLHIFEPDNLLDLGSPKRVHKKKYKVIDWFKASKNSIQKTDLIETENDFVNQVWFFRKVQNQFKDFLVVSYIDEENLRDTQYSPAMVRLDTKILLDEYGGSEMNIIEREVVNQNVYFYEDRDDIEFHNNETFLEVMENNDFNETTASKILERIYNDIPEHERRRY